MYVLQLLTTVYHFDVQNPQNLPDSWSADHLRDFVEVVTSSLVIADDGIQVFRGLNHTALLTLEEPATGMSVAFGLTLRLGHRVINNFAVKRC